jgi:hypothetical protein
MGTSLLRRAGIATGYGLDDRGVGVREPVGPRIFNSPCRPVLQAHILVMGTDRCPTQGPTRRSWMFVILPPIVRVGNPFCWLSMKYTSLVATAEQKGSEHENKC